MTKFLYSLLAFSALFSGSMIEANALHREQYGEQLNARFMLTNDQKIDSLVNIPLRASWWSRPYEYAWASQFAGEDYTVLDAACGVSHPFKWHLGQTCKSTWACDGDPRIDNFDSVLQETFDDLGYTAYQILVNCPDLHKQVTLTTDSICNLPASMPQFDRIFCISTLEHLCDKDRKDAMTQFAKFLAPNGLLVLTVDYPEVTPESLIAMAESVGLVPAGDVDTKRPIRNLVTNGSFSIYRIVFTHKE